ncbi:MAG: TadE/TadG family type IV pilus assembly protein [Hyphomicrobiales bacterium]
MLKKISELLQRFARAERGNVAVLFSLTIPVVMGGVAFGVDAAQVHLQRSGLQDAADAAALGAAKELYMTSGRTNAVQAIAEAYAKANLGRYAETVRVVAQVVDQGGAVQVALTDRTRMYFASFMGGEDSDISASATARIAGGGRICVIGLNEENKATIRLKSKTSITAPTCAIYSNSKSKDGLDVQSSSKIISELICSAGGYKGKGTSFKPGPTTDCPTAEDPLAGRAVVSTNGCDFTDYQVDEGDFVIAKPGIYCNGITVKKKATLTLSEGVYVIKGGVLKVEGDAVLKADYAGLYFAEDATIEFGKDTTIDLNGARAGEMAGLLMFEDPNAKTGNIYEIYSHNASNLTGTIYLPKGKLKIQGDVTKETGKNGKAADEEEDEDEAEAGATEDYDIAHQSAYTAIVVNQLELAKGPNLVLKTDYGATDVPVPDGIAPIGRNIWIEE